MELICKRTEFHDTATIGELTLDGNWICYTLEDKFREVLGQSVSSWKVPGKTAIPNGRYLLTFENSPRFGLDTLTLHNVPGFVGVRVHAGNTAEDTEGCPLVGMRVEGHGIADSRMALYKVKALVKEAKEAVYWNVTT